MARRIIGRFFFVTLLLLLAALVGQSRADFYSWNYANFPGGGYWTEANKWIPYGVPGDGDRVALALSNPTDCLITYDNLLGASQTLSSLEIRTAIGAGNMILEIPSLYDPTLNTQSAMIGDMGTGALVKQFGGSFNAIEFLNLGTSSGTKGEYILWDGSLAAGNEYVGQKGTGTITQYGGSNTVAGYLTVGWETWRLWLLHHVEWRS